MKISIFDFPFPPSSNLTRRSFFNQRSKRMTHYDTPIYKQYKTACASWALGEWKSLREIIPRLQAEVRKPGTILTIDSYFVFKKSNLWTKDGRLKRVDTSNRIKACHDELSKHIRVDDLFFNVGRAERTWAEDSEKERVIIVIRIDRLRQLHEFQELMTEKAIST